MLLASIAPDLTLTLIVAQSGWIPFPQGKMFLQRGLKFSGTLTSIWVPKARMFLT